MKQILIKDPRTHQIIGSAMEVHRSLGHGFLEAVYHEALGMEFASKRIPFQKEDSQIINYLKATKLEVGLLLNFGTPSLEYKRFTFTNKSIKSVKSADLI
jgi:hypothetical protein